MFSFFKKKVNPIEYTNEGAHGRHWYGLLGREIDPSEIANLVSPLFNNPIGTIVNNGTLIVNNDIMRGLVRENTAFTVFPCLKSSKHQQLEISFISEWSHARGLEAIIHAGHPCGAGINFFATDYAINKEVYKENKNVNVSLIGFVYNIQEFDPKEFKLPGIDNQEFTMSDDFCGYTPADQSDEINFMAKVFKVEKRTFSYVNGYIVTIGITPDFIIDLFIAQDCLDFELAENKHISGYAWITGTLEK